MENLIFMRYLLKGTMSKRLTQQANLCSQKGKEGVSDLALDWKRGWWLPCFDTNLTPFHF